MAIQHKGDAADIKRRMSKATLMSTRDGRVDVL